MISPGRAVSIDDVAGHYDALDDLYRLVWGEHLHHGLWLTGRETPEHAVGQLVRTVAARIGVAPGDTICDVGCGYGATARQLVDEFGAQVVGFTISPQQRAYGARHCAGYRHLSLRLGDWAANDLAPRSCDGVVSIECLAHVTDKPRFFAEISRVLKPGRTAAITAWLAADTPRKWQIRHLLQPICAEGRLAGMGTAAEYTRMIRAAGLELVSFESLGRAVRRTWIICARRLGSGLLCRAEYRRLVTRLPFRHWTFVLTMMRIIIAYRVRAMDYGLFVVRRPDRTGGATKTHERAGVDRRVNGRRRPHYGGEW